MRPSEYTAALLKELLAKPLTVQGTRVFEAGCGSGVVLAALADLGAQSLCGVDLEPEAVTATSALLRDLGHGGRSTIHCGSLWEHAVGRRFDLVVANLPHFPMQPAPFGTRLPSWGCGGHDGRRVLDPFLEGLADHLASDGRAVITHNAFVGLDRTRELLRHRDLSLHVANMVMVYIPQEKMRLMAPAILAQELGRTIWQIGPYFFAEVHIVEIATRLAAD